MGGEGDPIGKSMTGSLKVVMKASSNSNLKIRSESK